MRLTMIILTTCLLQVSAAGFGQKITLHEKNASLSSILNKIRAQSGYDFLGDTQLIRRAAPITVSVSNVSIEDALKACFDSHFITFFITDKIVVFKLKEEQVSPTPVSNIKTMNISGNVVDDRGESLPGATVRVKGTNTIVITDSNGAFTLKNIEENAVLIISYIGYTSQELKAAPNLTIKLYVLASNLNDVVVVGYGTQKKQNLSTAVSSVTSKTIEKLSITRVEQALQGNAPGVLVLNQNGQPGDKPMIRIRGTGTNNNPDPLFIVDGFPVSNIEYLNPGDIERMDVLKDAASAAIYGARGANGVILITTKTGKAGQPTLSYDGYYGVQNTWRKLPVLNATQYATMMNVGAQNANPTNPVPYPNPDSYGIGTNWQDALFRKNAPIFNHQVTASGGGDKGTYLAEFSYFNQQGVIGGDNSDFKRYTFRLNVDQKITDFLKIGTNINYIHSERSAIFDNGDQGGQVLGNAVNIDPLTPLYETDPAKLAAYNVNAVKNGTQVYGISPQATFPNPLAQLAIINGKNKIDKLLGNAYAEINLWKGLKFRSTFGMDLGNYNSNSYTPPYYLLPTSGQNYSSVSTNFSRDYTWQTENVLSYAHDFGKHNIQVLAGQSAYKYTYQNLGGSRNDPSPIDPSLAYIDVATDIASSKNNGGADTRTLASYFGRLAYNYDDKYLVSGVIRRDGSSRFGRNHPYATFPSVSGAWIISKEDFFKPSAVSFLKIRASWGQNGNENLGSSFPWASTIITNDNGYTFLNNGVEYLASGASLGAIANPNLKWETSEQTDFGLDLNLFKNKLSLTTDYYVKTTKDLLIRPNILASVGYSAPYINGGNVQNKGIELGINYSDKIGKDFGINLSFNVSHNVNKVTKINNTAQAIPGAAYISLGSITRMAVGEPIGYFWGVKTGGIFQSQAEVDAYTFTDPNTGVVKKIQPNAKPGDLKFIDINNDGVINDLDRTNIGDPNPKYITGFTINLDYKNFDFSVFTIGMFGQKVFNGNYRFDKTVSNLPATMLDSWTPDNPNAKFPRFISTDPNKNYATVSDLLLENGSFVRVKNIQLGYSLPKNLISNIKLSNVRVFAAVDNAFTITKYTGFDPELGATSPLSLGIDRGVYPQSRTFRFGIIAKL
ncbi:MAG: TonB-dependent receptor [Candidatus Pedobacter colombiensis]|uniref:TonB-dependent receptor n=1 Tax=Candidatus Pedobacter colombiensis TaxID=3121371 RepID=A0AAJ5W7U8_9SPHI|nr:TonB-dependent receptor [Pedobacter sp.]WEK18685.1 MAG: TonB-dependent receptor [Pedobacter sp.]